MFIYDDDLESSYSGLLFKLYAGKKRNFELENSFILFAIKGSFSLVSGEYENVEVKEKEMVFIHAGLACTIIAQEKTEIMLIQFPEVLSFCYCYIPEVMKQKEFISDSLSVPISMKKYVHIWADFVKMLISELTNPHPLLRAKMHELFLLFKLSYSREMLSGFFYPVLSSNYDFTLFVLNNYNKVRTVSELVELSTFSFSGFEKEFRKVFGTTPYKWMLKKKMKKLYYEISTTNKLFKVIAEEYGFLSLSQMGDFCRKHFGASPREIRNKK